MSNVQPASGMPAQQSTQMQTPQGAMAAQPGMMTQPGMTTQPGMMTQPGMTPQPAMMPGGHLYIQTNEIRNCVIHYFRAPDGKLSEMERVFTAGAGSGTFKPVSGQESAPNAFEGANSVIMTPDRRFLFATNGGDNSVSSFAVNVDGKLSLLDAKRTGNVVDGRSGTAKALAFSPSHKMLYVLHSFGPAHLRLMSVDDDGMLSARPEGYTVNTTDKPDRVATMSALTADEKFLVVGTTFDQPPTANPDGSPIIWVQKNGAPHSIASNAPDPDGLIVFPVEAHGTLGKAKFQDGGGASPWNVQFLRHRPDHFALGYAVGDGVALGRIDEEGNLEIGPIAQLDTTGGLPSELCWLSLAPDDRMVYSANFGYGYASSFRIEGNVISIAQDPACPRVPGDGTFRPLNGTLGSGPADNWICPTGAFYYQLYPNASKLIGYAIHADGALEQITSAEIPYQSPQGMTGF
ncbi:MAG TPA: beta-propeller fold lactonase family protein [Streptosporangiaceae bacterium]|nr:beta-propeller fold lactonase family protein [Streptosporangiaceae bacterium]